MVKEDELDAYETPTGGLLKEVVSEPYDLVEA
jgi:hypothetical protein